MSDQHPSPDTDAIAAAEQRDFWERKAVAWFARLRDVEARITQQGDHEYYDPDIYDLHAWRGEALLCGLSNRLGYAVSAASDIALYGRPFYCPEHGEERQPGWQARLCLECAWDANLADDALRLARQRVRAWKRGQAA